MLTGRASSQSIVEDAINALLALGYIFAAADKAVFRVKDQASTVEELIRLSLQQMA